MNNNWHFNYIGKIDVYPLKKIIDGPWDNEISILRRLRGLRGGPHYNVECIPLMFDFANIEQNDISVPAEKTEFYDEFYDEYFFNELTKKLTLAYGEGHILRIIFLKLFANKNIKRHFDASDTLIKNHRIHIPIYTNDKVDFIVSNFQDPCEEDVIMQMKEGSIWEINNEIYHEVQNNSNQDRIHLMVDWYVKDE
jgi:hypothetical protein